MRRKLTISAPPAGLTSPFRKLAALYGLIRPFRIVASTAMHGLNPLCAPNYLHGFKYLRKIVAAVILLSCLWPAKSRAQYGLYRFSRLDINQGLSHNGVNCFFKDERGFLWIGTMSGLNRYDGYKFKIFKHDLRDTTSLSNDYIEKILEGPDHKLMIFTRSGINIYNPKTERLDRNAQDFFESIHIPNTNIIGTIADIKKDSLGNFWFLTDGYSGSPGTGIYKYNPTDKKTTRFYHRDWNGTSLYSDNIASFALGTDGNWWIVYKDGTIDEMQGATGRIILRTTALKDISRQPSLNYMTFADRQNDLWIFASSSSEGVYYYKTATGQVTHIEKGAGKYSLNTNIVTGVIQDSKEFVWIATDHGGINLLDKKDFSIRCLMNREEDDKSLSQNSASSIYRDKDDIVWIGTYKKGISYHHEGIMKFPLFRHMIPGAKNLNYDDVNHFVEDPKGNLWIGTNGGGLLYFNRQTGKFSQYVHNPTDPASLTNDIIVSLCLDHEQKLWIGTYFGGLDCYDGKTFRHFRHNDKDTNSVGDDRIWEILEDSRKRLWIGTFSQGLDLYDRTKNVFIHHKPFAPNSVQSGYITGLTEDAKGNLWIATAYGLNELENSTGLFYFYRHEDDHPTTSLSNNGTFRAREDSRGLIWVTTREGLDAFDPLTRQFRTFRTEDGLPDNTVLEVLEDDDHNLWLSTPNGLSHAIVTMDPDTRKISCQFTNYDESDGLQGREFNEKSAFRTSRGELIFGGAYGFNIFDPQQIRPIPKRQPLMLTDFQVFNKSVGINQELNGHIILSQSIAETKTITLRYNENVFSIEFTALDYSNPEKVRYAYHLEGFNKEWLMANDGTRRATFTNLDPGDYVFQVKTINDKGDWNPEQVSLNVKILPPWWKTPLAYVAYGMLLIGLLLFARRIVLQRARLRFALEQERKEAQRLHELDMMKIRFFTNVSHEFRTPLSLILTPLDKIIRDTDNTARRSQFQLIHRNARRLLNLVNQLLDFRKLEEQELKLSLSKGDIVKFVRELSFSFADMAEKKNISFSFHTAENHLETLFDQNKLERIVFNLLSNAFKFTPEGGSIRVELNLLAGTDTREPGLLQLVIKDTGIGIEKEKQEKIFDRFFQDEIPGSMVNQGSGIGLAITREFVKLHKGSIHLESEPGKGSSFIVLLPVEKIGQGMENFPDAEDEQSDGSFAVIPAGPLNQYLTEETHERLPTEPDGSSGEPYETSVSGSHNGAWSRNSSGSESESGSPGIPHGAGRTKKPAILLVEDNEDFRFYLKDNLREFFTIVEASNGKEGWQRTLGSHPDLVVSDISMPEMNGIDLCRKIRSDKRTSFVPVILLTALIGEEQQLKGLETGASDYMTKPFNFGILLSKIRNLLAQQETARKTWQKQVDASPAKTKVDSPDEKFIRQALIIIEKNISNSDFSVEEMSRELFVSRVALYKRVLALTGKTPIEFIRSIRLKRAAQLLEKSRFTVAEIAYECGFNNPKYFSRYFKAEFGMLPSTYQARKRQES